MSLINRIKFDLAFFIQPDSPLQLKYLVHLNLV